ncbi:MAG: hypothetical protein ACR5LG_14360 [Sodalis sp. (in: enterobacteria)]|uniref:hypothetical protein n=1 Tax=Sodalis sp. (in: enterobacteria) TaxID=1898979 RepID=UPI003F3BA40F
MDPISTINIKKDSSFAMLLEAQSRGHEIHYMEMSSLYLRGGAARASTRLLSVKQDYDAWYSFNGEQDINLGELDVILMRKDPPFDTEFIYATYILERAEDEGALIVNKSQSLRDCNEKLFVYRLVRAPYAGYAGKPPGRSHPRFLAGARRHHPETAGWHGRYVDFSRQARRSQPDGHC